MTQFLKIDKWLATGDVKRAEAHIARLLRESFSTQEQANLMLRRARARLLTERADEALEDLQKAQSLDPSLSERPDIMEMLGDVYLARFELSPVGFAMRSDADRALAIYQQLAELKPIYPNLGWILYQWGRILLNRDQVDEAIQKFEEAILKPSTVPALTAFCYERIGFIYLIDKRDAVMALSMFSRAANTYPRDEASGWLVRLHLLRSRAFRDQNMVAEAYQAAQIALATVNPNDPDYRAELIDTHLSLGEILAKIPGREKEATENLGLYLHYSRKPQGIDVTWSRVHETLGELYFRIERYELAIEAYRAALTYNPYHPLEVALYYQIARCNYRMREYDKTILAIQRMLQSAEIEGQPVTDYRVYSMFAGSYFALERYTDAAKMYQRAIDLAPEKAETLDELKVYLAAAQNYAQQRPAVT